jgi:hypothetical protein
MPLLFHWIVQLLTGLPTRRVLPRRRAVSKPWDMPRQLQNQTFTPYTIRPHRKRHAMKIEPDPGSEAARKRGCKCPVLDNNRGAFPPFRDENGKGHYWISGGCPLHHVSTTESDTP